MFYKQKRGSGFTLIDLLVSIAIMTLLTLTSVISFRQAERNQDLNNSAEVFASQIRELENLSLTGKAIEILGEPEPLVPPGGYGIYFSRSGTDIDYLSFADMNRNLLYQEGIIVDPFIHPDQLIGLKSGTPLGRDVYIARVFWLKGSQFELNDGENLNIVFKIPEAKVYINGASNITSVSIELKHKITQKTKTITIFPISRQVNIE